MRLFAPSLPYFFMSRSLNIRNASAGSVVVPDFEMTLTEKSLSLQISISSARVEELMVLPAK